MKKRKSVSLSVGRGEKSKKGGLTAKGRAKYIRATGSNLKAPVTKKNPTGKAKARRKSFCARMCGMKKKLTCLVKSDRGWGFTLLLLSSYS